MVELLENLLYISMNNITSACVSREQFQNAYVFESNLYLRNPSPIGKYRYVSCYLGVLVEQTPDWCFDVDDVLCILRQNHYRVRVEECS